MSAVAAVIVMMLWIGYLFFNKDTRVSVPLLIIGVILAIGFIIEEIDYTRKKLEYEPHGHL